MVHASLHWHKGTRRVSSSYYSKHKQGTSGKLVAKRAPPALPSVTKHCRNRSAGIRQQHQAINSPVIEQISSKTATMNAERSQSAN